MSTLTERLAPYAPFVIAQGNPGTRGGLRIDRGTPWGNPFKIGPDGDRETVVLKFAEKLRRMDPEARTEWLKPVLDALSAGRKLVCWCSPRLCHGQVLAAYALKETTRANDD